MVIWRKGSRVARAWNAFAYCWSMCCIVFSILMGQWLTFDRYFSVFGHCILMQHIVLCIWSTHFITKLSTLYRSAAYFVGIVFDLISFRSPWNFSSTHALWGSRRKWQTSLWMKLYGSAALTSRHRLNGNKTHLTNLPTCSKYFWKCIDFPWLNAARWLPQKCPLLSLLTNVSLMLHYSMHYPYTPILNRDVEVLGHLHP